LPPESQELDAALSWETEAFEGRNPKTKPNAERDSGFGLLSAFGFDPLTPGSANLSLTPRFSGVAFGADDLETVSTVSIHRSTKG